MASANGWVAKLKERIFWLLSVAKSRSSSNMTMVTWGGGAIVGALVCWWWWYRKYVVQKPLLRYRTDSAMQQIVARCPSLQREYWPTQWATNCHAQLVLYLLHGWLHRRSPYRRQTLCTDDGGQISLDWFDSDTSSSTTIHKTVASDVPDLKDSSPIVLVLHGITGSSDDMQSFVSVIRKKGWRACVFNRRGHGNMPLSSPKFHVFGSTSDLRLVVNNIHQAFPSAPIMIAGISAGSALLVRYLGEEGKSTIVTCGVAISPGYDTSVCIERIHPLYDGVLRKNIKKLFLESNAHQFSDHPNYQHAISAQSAHHLISHASVVGGYQTVDDYLGQSNPVDVLDTIAVPVMCINAADDPVCTWKNVEDHMHVFDTMPSGLLVGTQRGSHVAFFEGMLCPSNWSERVSVEFMDAVLAYRNNLPGVDFVALFASKEEAGANTIKSG